MTTIQFVSTNVIYTLLFTKTFGFFFSSSIVIFHTRSFGLQLTDHKVLTDKKNSIACDAKTKTVIYDGRMPISPLNLSLKEDILFLF